MTLDDLKPGLRHSATLTVGDRLAVPAQAEIFSPGADMPPVFATAQMIAFVEWTCVGALAPYLGSHQRTVGTRVEMSHIAATPIGMKVTPRSNWSRLRTAPCASRRSAGTKRS
jgi:fluoroacetyl-CoA thioesterase